MGACNDPRALGIFKKRAIEAIKALVVCIPPAAGITGLSARITGCTTLDEAQSILNLAVQETLCWLGTGGAGESCNWPTSCPTFTVETPASYGALFLYDSRARGFNVPNLVHASDKLYFQASDADENYTMSYLTDINLPLLETVQGPFYCVAQKVLTRINMPLLTSVSSIMHIVANPLLTDLNMPNLATVGGDLEIDGNGITSFIHPLLTFVGGEFRCATDTLVTVDLSGLTTVVGDFRMEGASLTTFRLPAFVTWGGNQWSNINSGLDAATVNYVLELLDGFGVSGGTKIIDLSGGTSAAPTGAGITAKANLIGRSVVVHTN